MPDRRRALIYRPGSLGDTLVSLPAIAEIRRRYPEHRLSLLTESQIAGSTTRVSPWTILKETGWFEDVYFYTVRPASIRERYHNLSLALRLRRNAYHDIFSLAPPRTTRQLRVDSTIFRGAVGARRYHAAHRAAWPPTELDPADVEHEGLRLLRIVDPHASSDVLRTFRLEVPDSDRLMGRGLLHDLGVRSDQLLVGVAPGSARSATAWPAERFAAVGKALLREFRNVVLLAIGGSNEQRLCEELCAAWGPRSHNLAGRLSVFGSASILSQCATFIGNDSGPTHLAALVGIPCVAIFSARNAPGQWEPIGPHHVVIEDRPECAGCMLDDCVREAKKCLTRIDTGRVVREAISLIESRRSCVAY
ncbi:MAG TPA: glycosyltransferase family 9 protein [Vicinamibacterales bacterium]|nr:glycosyltransferase family 9 protein [Vicinamibacterales bacterium]